MKKPERIDTSKKQYVVSIRHNRGMLHINDGRCWHIPKAGEYADYDNEQSAMRAYNYNLKKC